MIMATASIGLLILGLGVSSLVMRDDTTHLGDKIFFSVCATLILVTVPVAMAVYLS